MVSVPALQEGGRLLRAEGGAGWPLVTWRGECLGMGSFRCEGSKSGASPPSLSMEDEQTTATQREESTLGRR